MKEFTLTKMTYCVKGVFDGNGQQYPCIYDADGNYSLLMSQSTSCTSGCVFAYDSSGNRLVNPVVGNVAKILVPPNVILNGSDMSGDPLFQLGGEFVREYNTTPMNGYGEVVLTGNTSPISTIAWNSDTPWSRFVSACGYQQIPAQECQQFASGSSAGWNAPFIADTGIPPIETSSNIWIVYFMVALFAVTLLVIVATSAYMSYDRNRRRIIVQQDYGKYDVFMEDI